MAVGPTENLSSGVLSLTGQQVQIATEVIQYFNTLMRGSTNARINPSGAISPAGSGAGASDASPGLGTRIDFRA